MKNYKSESTVRPQEWDKTSSPDRVYHNENVVEVPATEETPVMYKYDVTEYTTQEYIEYLETVNKNSIADLEDAVLELGEIIGG